MKRLSLRIAFALLAGAAVAPADAADLAATLRAQDGWVAYEVPIAPDAGTPCCYADYKDHHGWGQCDLDGHGWNIGRDDNDHGVPASDTLRVYVHVAHGEIDKLRGFAATCPLRDGATVRRLENVSAEASVALLRDLARSAAPHAREDDALSLLAMHATPAADNALLDLSAPREPRKQREQALFWLAQLRGLSGARHVEKAAREDPDPELRAEAVFDLSQARAIDGYVSIRDIAQRDTSTHVRSQALFWMAQMGDARAQADITAALGRDSSAEVREQAVFALSQLKSGAAAAALIALVRGDYPREVKKQALFWLGESGSDEAMQFLDEVLARKPDAARK